MTRHDHIQELRAELFACCNTQELIEIQRELQVAEHQQAAMGTAFAAWLDDG